MSLFEIPRTIHAKKESSSKLGWVESGSKVLIPVTAAFYAIGLLAINAYLDKIGASEFSLVRYQAALIGILAVVPLLFGAVLSQLILWIVRDTWSHGRILYYRRHLLSKRELSGHLMGGVNGVFMASSIAVAGFKVAQLVPDTEDMWVFFFSCVSIIAFGQILVFGFIRKPRPTKISPLNRELLWFTEAVEDPKIWAPYPIIMVSLSTFLYINLFGTYVYPTLNQSIGGAKPRDAQILFAQEDTSIATLLDIPTVRGGRLSAPIKLLYLAGDQIYIRATRERVVQIDRKHISGICFPKVEASDSESQPNASTEPACLLPSNLEVRASHGSP